METYNVDVSGIAGSGTPHIEFDDTGVPNILARERDAVNYFNTPFSVSDHFLRAFSDNQERASAIISGWGVPHGGDVVFEGLKKNNVLDALGFEGFP